MAWFWVVAVVAAILIVAAVKASPKMGRDAESGPSGAAALPKIRGDGRFAVEVVGESFYREALAALFPRRLDDEDEERDAEALLVLEARNEHDSSAVGVYIAGRKVGHLARAMARDFRAAVERDGLVHYGQFLVDAVVLVPSDDEMHYSVSIDLPQEAA